MYFDYDIFLMSILKNSFYKRLGPKFKRSLGYGVKKGKRDQSVNTATFRFKYKSNSK